jgi:acylglycerol lipase
MDNSSFLKRYEYQRLVKRGIAFVSIEYEGHGRSDGPLCYINKFDNIIQDAYTFFRETCHSRFPGKKYFLMGESMGGAVAFDIYLKSISSTATTTTTTENTLSCSNTNHTQKVESSFSFAGVILCCPMAKISQELLPKAWVINAFQQIVGPSGCNRWIGLLPLSPTGEMNGFRLVQKRALAQSVPTWYGLRKPRLATGRELLVRMHFLLSFLQSHFCFVSLLRLSYLLINF